MQPQSVFSTYVITGGCCLNERSQTFKNISNVYSHFYNKLFASLVGQVYNVCLAGDTLAGIYQVLQL